ncbi:methylenetetrahydrofolate reductase [Pleurocapsales cyanobacterium LEGE 10410]|nr:methylenetetrahydrofolate reductase [Pleurocapsales cyanobacterium LEGE 10410]
MKVSTIELSQNIQPSFRSAAKAKEFLITAEVSPPKGGNSDRLVQMALTLKNRVHAINLTDGSRAVLRMSPLAASAILLEQGIEPICQMVCRDRNRIALQADLMGANALGIRNILALTGDPVKVGDCPRARGVFDLESVRLLQTIERLNRGYDGNDRRLSDGATDLFAGAAVDPQSSSWSGLQQRFERKLAAGAEFFQSQAVFDFDRLEKFMQVATPFGKPILAGIFLLKSAKNARFLNRCVPGVKIPETTIARLEQASEPLLEGMLIAAEQVQLARQLCQGVHLMAVKREELIPQILDLAGVPTLSKSVSKPQSTLAQF